MMQASLASPSIHPELSTLHQSAFPKKEGVHAKRLRTTANRVICAELCDNVSGVALCSRALTLEFLPPEQG